jgi:hypothetical protein
MTATQPWNRLEIRGFRGLADLQLDQLGTFNLLLGANDVGKTSVLEAVFLLAALPNPEAPGQLQYLRDHPVEFLDDLASLFYGGDLDRVVELSARSSDPDGPRTLRISAPYLDRAIMARTGAPVSAGSRRRPLAASKPVKPRQLRLEAQVRPPAPAEPRSMVGTLIDIGKGFELNIETDLPTDEVNRTPIPVGFVPSTKGYDAGVIAGVGVRKKKGLLLEYLRGINPQIQDIEVDGKIAYVDIGLTEMLPLNMFGAGLVAATQLLAVGIGEDYQILLVDEIDYGLHYKAIPPLLETLLTLCRDRDIQLFATTHRLDVVRGLLDVLGRDDLASHRSTTKCFTLQRDREDRVRAYRYDYAQFDHCIRHGIEIR